MNNDNKYPLTKINITMHDFTLLRKNVKFRKIYSK